MGKVITPKYRVEYRTNNLSVVKSMIWNVKSRTNVTGYGNPNLANLKEWRTVYNYSFKDGVNKHISEGAGFIVYISWCRIVDQETGQTVVEFKPPMFEVM